MTLTDSAEATKQRLEDVLDALWKNWAFRLSLSSNELFHSNILQFFAESHAADCSPIPVDGSSVGTSAPVTDLDEGLALDTGGDGPQAISPAAARNLLSIVAGGHTCQAELAKWLADDAVLTVQREWNDMDLAVLVHCKGHRPRPLFAIEIKIKSYPRDSQLVDYLKKLRSYWDSEGSFQPLLFLLTGMGSDVGAGAGVPVIGFDALAVKLRDWAVPARLVPVRDEYVELCELLHGLFTLLTDHLTPLVTMKQVHEVAAVLTPFRLHAVWWKLWASFIELQCRKVVDPWPANLHADHHFTQVGVAEVYWRSGSREGAKPRCMSVGIQIQGSSVRLFLNLVDDALGGKTEAREGAERALLHLCERLGVFAANPRMAHYLAHWSKSGKRYSNSWTGLERLSHVASNSPVGQIVDCGTGWGRRKRGEDFEPLLHGYANGKGNGHADFRLTLKDSAQVNDVVDLVKRVAVDDLFSKSNTGEVPIGKPLLKHAVELYAADPSAWFEEYAGSSRARTSIYSIQTAHLNRPITLS